MNVPVPCPKQFFLTGATVPAPQTVVCRDAEFSRAVSVFCSYAERAFGVRFTEAESGILVEKEAFDDEYRIEIGETVSIKASSEEGLQHAFATLLQLFRKTDGGLFLPRGSAADRGDCEWRGLSLDLARCWHPAEYLFRAADLCWLYKMNRLQLHLTDNEGVRFPFEAFPDAVSKEHYTAEELSRLREYCEARSIVLVPEVDAPGHSLPFNQAYPEIFGAQEGLMSASEETFAALETVFSELARMFPSSPWIHVGGDEASVALWDSCPKSKAYCEANGISDSAALYGHFILRLTDTVRGLGRKPLVWEGFHASCDGLLPKDITVFAWESYYQLPPDLIAGGFRILNASWKPLYIVPHGKMWPPKDILTWRKTRWENWWEASPASKAPIYVAPDAEVGGGQLCVWGDLMRPKNAYAPIPDMIREEYDAVKIRLPALAERLWNENGTPDPAAFVWNAKKAEALLDGIS